MKLIYLFIAIVVAYDPVILFHGLGDACRNPGFNSLVKYLRSSLDGTKVECVESGGGLEGFDWNMLKQAEHGCNYIKKNYSGKNI